MPRGPSTSPHAPGRLPVSKRLVISAATSARDPLFRRAFALYSQAFPPSEKIDRDYFHNLFEEKRLGLLAPFNFHFLVAHQRGRVIGFISGTYLAIANFGFVGYLAVRPTAGGRQVGSKLRRRLIGMIQKDARASGHAHLMGMVGEVEHGNPWLERMRRRGALALDIDYFQPSTDGTAVVPLVLYLQPLGAGRRIRSLTATSVRRIIYAIYRRLYRIRFPLKQPEFKLMLRQLEGRPRVGSKPMEPPAAVVAPAARKRRRRGLVGVE